MAQRNTLKALPLMHRPKTVGSRTRRMWHAPPLPREVGFEERLGTRWAVWVGGVALALGALLLVRYSIEQGLLGPGMRVALGALLARPLIAAGEWLRRSETKIEIEAIPSAHIPGVLTAAGTVAAFGTVYAAHALYGFIGPSAAFTLLGAVGVAAMLAAGLARTGHGRPRARRVVPGADAGFDHDAQSLAAGGVPRHRRRDGLCARLRSKAGIG